MEFIKCKDCVNGINGYKHNCKLGTRSESIEYSRGCYAGEKICSRSLISENNTTEEILKRHENKSNTLL